MKIDGLQDPIHILHPQSLKREHRSKVRDLKFSSRMGTAYSVSADEMVKVWDVKAQRVVSSIHLDHVSEIICLGVDQAVPQVCSIG